MGDVISKLPVQIFGLNGEDILSIATNAAGAVKVSLTEDALRYADGVEAAGKVGIPSMGTDGTNLQIIATDDSGIVQVAINGGDALMGKVKLTDGTNDAEISATGAVHVRLSEQGVPLAISQNDQPNSEGNPLWVKTTDAVSGIELHDFSVATAVAKEGSDNHDYAIPSGKTLTLRKIILSGSGACKVEVQVGPAASLVTKAVAFNSTANPQAEIVFEPALEIAEAGGSEMVRLIRSNRDNQAQDLYSTIMGSTV